MHDNSSVEPSLKSLFIRAVNISDKQRRRDYLDEVGAVHPELKDELERLLSARSLSDSGPVGRVERWLEPYQLTVETEEQSETTDFEIPRNIGPYELLEKIGEGGMGTVYLARQAHPVSRDVALKLIKPGMDSHEMLVRFKTEMQMLGMMQHPNIASVLDAGLTPQGHPYFAMELVRGLPIDKHCVQKSVPIRARLELFISVCRAVQHAHNRGVIHRDLKPSNVLILDQDGIPTVKVIDFGIAKAMDSDDDQRTRLTRFTQLIGTPLYMSPEQVSEDVETVDNRSDIYSLGVMLYELVTGSPPIDRELLRSAGVNRIRRLITEEKPPRPSQCIDLTNSLEDARTAEKSIGRDLDWIVLRSLEKEPARRYQSTSELAEDLQRYLDGDRVLAGPPSVVDRMQARLRKHLKHVAVGTVFVVFLALGGAVLYGLYRQAQTENRRYQVLVEQASNLRQANVLQSTIRAMTNHDLAAMRDLLKEERQTVAAESSATTAKSTSFVSWLEAIANPEPLASSLHSAPIRGIACSSETEQVFGADEAGNVFMCDLSLSSPIEILGRHSGRADSIAVSPDGTHLVSAALDGQIWLWDLKTKQVIRQLAPLESGVETLIWSPDGTTIAAGARYSEFVVYDSAGEELLRQPNDHRHESLLFSPDSQHLIVPTRESLEIWHIGSGQLARKLDTDRLSNVRTMCWAGPDSKWLIIGERFSEDLVAIDFMTGATLGAFKVGAQYAVALSGSPDGRTMSAAYSNGRVQLIGLSALRSGNVQGEVVLKLPAHKFTEEENAPMEARWVDRNRFLTAAADGAIKLWDADQLSSSTIMLPPRDLLGINWLRKRSIARYFHGDSFGNYRQPDDISRKSDFVPQVFDYAAVGNRIAAAAEYRIGILNAETRTWVSYFDSPMAEHHFVVLSEDGSHIAASSDSQICIWRTEDDWQSQRLVQTWPFETSVKPEFSRDMHSLFVDNVEFSNLLQLDIATGREIQRFAGSEKGNLALDRSGKLLATATERGLRVWDLKDHNVVFEVTDLSQPLSFQFFEEEQVLVSGHLSGEVRAWHLPTKQPLGTLFTPSKWLGRLVDFQLSPDETGLLLRYRNPTNIRPVVLGRVNLHQR